MYFGQFSYYIYICLCCQKTCPCDLPLKATGKRALVLFAWFCFLISTSLFPFLTEVILAK